MHKIRALCLLIRTEILKRLLLAGDADGYVPGMAVTVKIPRRLNISPSGPYIMIQKIKYIIRPYKR